LFLDHDRSHFVSVIAASCFVDSSFKVLNWHWLLAPERSHKNSIAIASTPSGAFRIGLVVILTVIATRLKG